jgi:L-fucose isomerase-like protein
MAFNKQVILGFMGNRGFFPTAFAVDGARQTRSVVERLLGGKAEYVDLGTIESYADAKKAATIAQRYKLDPNGDGCIGIICSMYNFSDENGIRDFLRLADLNVPVLIHTEPDTRGKGKMGETGRRDGACGRFSATNALRHIGHPYTLTTFHCEAVDSKPFADDVQAFFSACQLANRFRRRGRGARVGLIGSGPDAFQTVTTVSTELLGHMGLNTVGMDLIQLDREMARLTAAQVERKLAEVKAYLPTAGVPADSLDTIARMSLVFDRFVADHDLDGVAVRCWTEMQKYKIGGRTGVVPCTAMAMLSDKLLPAACEVDIGGWMGMMLLQTASGLIPALGDWNNMFDDARNEIDLFHCGVWAKSVLRPGAKMADQQIIATDPDVRQENTWGTVDGDLIAGTCAFARPCTNAREGKIFLYAGVGTVKEEAIKTFGTKGRIWIPRLQEFFTRITAFEDATEHHCPVVVGDRERIRLGMQALRWAVPYINHQAGLNSSGRALIEYFEHDQVAELAGGPT